MRPPWLAGTVAAPRIPCCVPPTSTVRSQAGALHAARTGPDQGSQTPPLVARAAIRSTSTKSFVHSSRSRCCPGCMAVAAAPLSITAGAGGGREGRRYSGHRWTPPAALWIPSNRPHAYFLRWGGGAADRGRSRHFESRGREVGRQMLQFPADAESVAQCRSLGGEPRARPVGSTRGRRSFRDVDCVGGIGMARPTPRSNSSEAGESSRWNHENLSHLSES